MKLLLLSLATFTLTACGVKLPPVPPEKPPVKTNPNLDCKTDDPTCDVEDPNYRPVKR